MQPLTDQVATLTHTAITAALERHRGCVAAAARDLAIPVRTLWYRIRRHRINLAAYRRGGNDNEPA